MMQSYEQGQKKLEALLQEALSDEDGSLFGDTYLSDEYTVDSDDSDTTENSCTEPPPKKCLRSGKKESETSSSVNYITSQPSTSTDVRSIVTDSISITQTIEEVIKNMTANSDEDILDSSTQNNVQIEDIIWGPVTDDSLNNFGFVDEGSGYRVELYDTYSNKTPYDFYKLFLDEDLLHILVSKILIKSYNYFAQAHNYR